MQGLVSVLAWHSIVCHVLIIRRSPSCICPRYILSFHVKFIIYLILSISFAEAQHKLILKLTKMTVEAIVTKAVHSLVAATLVGNVLVCLAILRNKVLQTPVNYLLMNLAISDFMIVISFSPRHILEGLY